ncbi:HdeD family acid-resistance protein [Dysgonomonas sp. 520]|uniref:HdeD family acid-resistance protein n=1 Tax=Dysgonomonas sp. 520 TaxID=2302931 RepID=UPI0013D0D440|nr:DUF308 domain-containing protein [Dysgonomonas sp. 520]NDW10835.1 hypothetical protein [Dysgonomonas sp. 520]
MKRNLDYYLKNKIKYWWVSLLIGIVVLSLGFWCIANPLSTIITFSYFFAISFLFSGLFEIIFAVSNKNSLHGWGWTLTSGIIDLLFGVILLSLPPASIATILAFFVGFWVMFRSIWGMATSIDLQRIGAKGWGWSLLLSILGIILSFIFIISPAFTSVVIVWIIGFAFLTYGIFRIYLAFQLRALNKELRR